MQQKLAMFYEFNFLYVGKPDCMNTDFRMLKYNLDIFTHYKQTHLFFFVCTTSFDQMFDVRFTYKVSSGWFYDVTMCP